MCKEKSDIKKKHKKAIKNERKSSTAIMVKLQTKHNKQLEKQLNDACNTCERKVVTKHATNAKLVKETNDLKTAAITNTRSKPINKGGLDTIAEMEHKIMNRLMNSKTKLNMNQMAANRKDINATKFRSNSMIQMALFL